MNCSCHPVQFAIPNHIFEAISQHGSKEQKLWAQRTIVQSERIRGQRDAIAASGLAAINPAGQKRRTVYDANGTYDLPGQLARGEGDPITGDDSVDQAYESAGIAFDFFLKVYGRNSLDDRGMRLDSSVHFGNSFDNAFWNGTQMVYGDGDDDLPDNERIFNRFTSCLEVIGHELVHGVTQHEANLMYFHQPGALNESISDVMGILIKQWHLKQKAVESDWLIGAGLFTPNVRARAVRSMKEPGTAYDDRILGGRDPQPAHMEHYINMPVWRDSGGVHINSGIPNRAFFVTAMEIGGHAWEHAGRIWYYALRDRLRRASNFYDAARRTYQVAGELYGEGSREQSAVHTGWDTVGINCKQIALAALDIL